MALFLCCLLGIVSLVYGQPLCEFICKFGQYTSIDLVPEHQLINACGIQLDWQHPMSPTALTTLERSSRSLMLDQELVLIHQPGIATPILVV